MEGDLIIGIIHCVNHFIKLIIVKDKKKLPVTTSPSL